MYVYITIYSTQSVHVHVVLHTNDDCTCTYTKLGTLILHKHPPPSPRSAGIPLPPPLLSGLDATAKGLHVHVLSELSGCGPCPLLGCCHCPHHLRVLWPHLLPTTLYTGGGETWDRVAADNNQVIMLCTQLSIFYTDFRPGCQVQFNPGALQNHVHTLHVHNI